MFIIYMNDIIENIESDILTFADDCSLFATGSDPAETSAKLNRDLENISHWAQRWKITFNSSKSKDIIFSNKYLNNSPPLILNNNYIDRVNVHKHLGLYLSSSLDWSVQVREVCLKANRKLSVLRSCKLLSRQTLDLLYKITVRSVIDYALPVYLKTLKQTEIARLEKLQYRASKLVTGAFPFASKDKLNVELGWETLEKRADILGLNMFHKIHLHETRPLIRSCMPKLDFERKHSLRSKGGYIPFKNYGTNFKKSFFAYFSGLWNSLPKNVQCKNLLDFKEYTNFEFKPRKYKHFSRGNKYSNSLLTKIRVGRSDLNQHKFTIGFNDSPQCLCYHREESPLHYFIDCFLYLPERQTLFSKIEHYIPNFKSFTKQRKLDLILRGFHVDNPDLLSLNTTLTIAVQNFILQTKRFSEYTPPPSTP